MVFAGLAGTYTVVNIILAKRTTMPQVEGEYQDGISTITRGTGASIGKLPLFILLAATGFRIRRWEGGVLLLGYAGYLAWLWPK